MKSLTYYTAWLPVIGLFIAMTTSLARMPWPGEAIFFRHVLISGVFIVIAVFITVFGVRFRKSRVEPK